MKKMIVFNFFLPILLFTSCVPGLLPNFLMGSGQVISETRAVSNFHTVTLAGLGDLTIMQGTTEALMITAEDNIMPYIRSGVRDGDLSLGFDPENWRTVPRTTKPIKFVLTLKKLDALTLAGQGNIDVANLKTVALKLFLTGQGDIRLVQLEAVDLACTLTGKGNMTVADAKVKQSSCTITGQGNIDLAGQLTGQAITITGQGDYQAGNLDSQAAQVTINGMGNVTVWVREQLDIEVFGKGTVAYYGNPTVVKNGFGAVEVHALGNK